MGKTVVGNLKKGFSIVELLIIVVVVGILSTILIISYNGARREADEKTATATLQKVNDAIKVWGLSDNSAIPVLLTEVDVEIPEGVTMEYWRFDNNTQYCLGAITTLGAAFYRNSTEGGSPKAGKCSEIASVAGEPLALNVAPGTTTSFTGISGTPNVTMYAVFGVNSITGAYETVAEMSPSTSTNRLRIQTDAGATSTMSYRIDTPLQSNLGSAQVGARSVGSHIGWLQLDDNLTYRNFAYDKATTHTSLALTASTLAFTGLTLGATTSSTTPIATVAYDSAHDEITRARVMQWLATKYSVPLTF